MSPPTVLGIDLGGSALKWVVLQGNQVAVAGHLPTPHEGPDAVVEAMVRIARPLERLDAAGVGLPGLYDRDGNVTLLPNVPGLWTNFPLKSVLEDCLAVPVGLANDGRAFTLAEMRLGAARAFDDVIGVTLGTGIGGGIAIGGRMHAGHHGRAGEVGHQTVAELGPPCGCGNRGCVEVFASAAAIVAGAARAVLQQVDTRLREACEGEVWRLTPQIVLDCAAAGDQFAEQVIARAGTALGVGLANLCSVLDPGCIVVGGGMAARLDDFRPYVEETLRARARLAPHPAVVPSTLGRRAGAIGAALWIREEAA